MDADSLTHSPVSPVSQEQFCLFQRGSHKSPVAMWFCNSTHLSDDRTGSWWTRLPWIWAAAWSMSNKLWLDSAPELKSLGQRVMGDRLPRGLMVLQLESGDRVCFQLCSDEVETLAVHLVLPAMAFSFTKWGHWTGRSPSFFIMIQFQQF